MLGVNNKELLKAENIRFAQKSVKNLRQLGRIKKEYLDNIQDRVYDLNKGEKEYKKKSV